MNQWKQAINSREDSNSIASYKLAGYEWRGRVRKKGAMGCGYGCFAILLGYQQPSGMLTNEASARRH